MIIYTLQVSDHPDAGLPGPNTQAAGESWQTVYDGCGTTRAARAAAVDLAGHYRHVRVFRGGRSGPGRLLYSIVRA